MGLFDLFREKAAKKDFKATAKAPEATVKCAECLRPIDGYVSRLYDKDFCQECYNRNMAIFMQTGGMASNAPGTGRDEDGEKTSDSALQTEEYLGDITFIWEMKHLQTGAWQQYDVLLATIGYGWDMMKDWADYMAEADLEHISEVTTGVLDLQTANITESYSQSGGKCKNTPELDAEMGMLSVAGLSKALSSQPVKIVWMNQTKVLRLFTIVDDEQLIQKYVETMVRRSFGTKYAMKLGKPIPEGK